MFKRHYFTVSLNLSVPEGSQSEKKQKLVKKLTSFCYGQVKISVSAKELHFTKLLA
jgi:hypothetical protein